MQGVLGLVALASGVALLAHIVAGISLLLGVSIAALVLIGAALWIRRSADDGDRRRIARTAGAAALAGLLATAAYDVTRTGLALIDQSAYNAFEAIRVFGMLLAGVNAPITVVYAVGMTYHVVNGVSFGVGYGFLFGRGGATDVRWALLTGVGWGLFLEAFQLTLYPGWLDIRAVAEFAQISAAAHVVYGATLGLACRWLLRRVDPEGAHA
ncbi:MAG: hypothetical protein ACRDGJ_02475 [Candidatus Limnocylindria bacterium]